MDLDEKATVRFETMPGLQGQMDWAYFEDYTVLESGKTKKLYCFVLIEAVLLCVNPWILTNALHRVCNRHEY